MANAVVKFEKIYANRSVKLLFGDRATIKINGVLKQVLSSSCDALLTNKPSFGESCSS